MLYRDRWAMHDSWRGHRIFRTGAMFSNALPGFGTAVVAFTAYVLVDNYILNKNKIKDDHHN